MAWREALKTQRPSAQDGSVPAPSDGARQAAGGFEPRYPRTVVIAGALWVVFGGVCVLRFLCVPLVGFWAGPLDAVNSVLMLACGIPIMLLGLLCAHAGLKYLRRTATARSTLVPGVVSVLFSVSYLCTGFLPGPSHFNNIWLGTLLAAGVFALIGGRTYRAWREAQELRP
jgi:hypothetical protein